MTDKPLTRRCTRTAITLISLRLTAQRPDTLSLMAWAVVAGVVFVAEIPTFALLVAAPLMVAAAVIAAGSAPGSAAVGKRKGIQT